MEDKASSCMCSPVHGTVIGMDTRKHLVCAPPPLHSSHHHTPHHSTHPQQLQHHKNHHHYYSYHSCHYHHHHKQHTPHQYHRHTTKHASSLNTVSRILAVVFLVLITTSAATAQQSCTDDSGCFPPVGNLALGRTIQVNSSCSADTQFCPLFLFAAADCQLCSESAHSASSLNDNDNSTFWVSEIGANTSQVALQLDFEAPVRFEGMTLVWQSVRPAAMVLERSCDNGETWSAYRYYALNCAFTFMMPNTFIASGGVGTFNGTTPICTSSQTELFSFGFTETVMTFSTSEHTPLSEQEAECYQTITNIRAVMIDFFPEVRVSNTSFHYYGVREWIVRGSCMCNGHAGSCLPRPGEEVVPGVNKVYTGCMCQHNTAPPNCDECLSGFNNAPYLPGTSQDANLCEACMCNGHASDCRYDTAQSTAVCLNCTDNTVGNQCENCTAGFYQDQALLLSDPNICRDCSCNTAGSADEAGACDDAGQCACKVNVMALTCNECQNGYFNLSATNPDGCHMCDCHASGSQLSEQGIPRCDNQTGMCLCQDSVFGERCDQCRPGSYDLDSGCLPCDCNVGGSTGPVCDQTSSPDGQCPCKPNIASTRCSMPRPGYYFQTLDSFRYEAEDIPGVAIVLPVDRRYGAFTGQGFASLPVNTTISFLISPPRDSQYELILRFSSAIIATYSISFSLSSLSPVETSLNCTETTPPLNVSLDSASTISPGLDAYSALASICLSGSAQYRFSLSYSRPSSPMLLLDSLVLMPDVSAVSAYYASSTLGFQRLIDTCLPRSASSDVVTRIECEEISFTLITEFLGDDPLLACECDSDGRLDFNSSECSAFGGGCGPCQPGVTGQQCNTCLNGFFGFSDNGCEACDCDPVGSLSPTCTESGQCLCKSGVGGPTCGDCLPDFFNLTSEGCILCDCSPFSSSASCNVTTGQCPCPEGVAGVACDSCDAGFYNLTADGCLPCDCDLAGSSSATCDQDSGQCPCTPGGNLGGRRCEECERGFFNTGGSTDRETCARCVCSGRSEVCSLNAEPSRLYAVYFNFSQLCTADPANCGDGWRVLTEGNNPVEVFFGPSGINGLGYILSVNMMPMIYVSEAFLGDRLSSYSLNFTAQLTVVSTATMKTDFSVRIRSSNTSLVGVPYLQVSGNSLEDSVHVVLTISLVEGNWFYEDSTQRRPTLLEFLDFLSNITEISFTADYTVDFLEFVYIRDVSLPSALPASSPAPAPNSSHSISLPDTYPVEQCACPAPYQGPSCEACARGYARPSGNIADSCSACNCSNMTLDCDMDTAMCLNCSGNTTGERCQRCMDGFYGDPTRNIPCLPCPCPLTLHSNRFSPTCVLNATDDLPTCDACTEGYMGRNCQFCMDGFYGNPMMGHCITCECNGNVDPALGPTCDMTTGQCLNCQNNTKGFECDICINGFYGDPGTGIPCRPCPCDVRGLDRYCDPLSGTCKCLPNVVGERCNTCRPGFFNITRGVGCSPCNCDPLGAIGQECNQDSGDCPCLPNVGSTDDNKCRMCTPDYFNFTADVGCQACGCSELAESTVCNASTGECTCQEEAVGMKCDDCAFGFTGQVPNCEPCHNCTFQWVEILKNLTRRADDLQTDITQLITTYYNGYTNETLTEEIARLRADLDAVNRSLGMVTLEEGAVEELELILNELNATLVMITNRLSRIEQDLDRLDLILDQLERFNGTINMTSVTELERRLQQLNDTAASLSREATQSLAQLTQDVAAIDAASAQITLLNSTAEYIIQGNLTEGASRLEPIAMLLDAISSTYATLRQNLTDLDVRASRLSLRLVALSARADVLASGVAAANSSLRALSEEVGRRSQEVQVLLQLVRTLNESLLSLEGVANDAESQAGSLANAAQLTLRLANSTLQDINETLCSVGRIGDDLTEALRVAEAVRSITLPPQEVADNLADRICRNIVPDELVEGIMEDVRDSRELAEQAMELARNASDAVTSALTMVMQLEEDLACTNNTQIEVEELQSLVENLIAQERADIDLVAALSSEAEQVYLSTIAAYNVTLQLINETSSLGVSARTQANQLLQRSMQQALQAMQYRNDTQEAQDELGRLETDTEEAAASANASLAVAELLRGEAEALERNINSISFEDISNLLGAFQQEVASTQALQQRIDGLTLEMEGLIQLFTSTSQRLQQECYRTP